MDAKSLYLRLEKDFISKDLSDDWTQEMKNLAEFICDNFKKRSMGTVCDFAIEINKVYTAVFPSKSVMQKIIDDGTENAMLFVHHPSIWDIRKKEIFYQMDKKQLSIFKERKISIYNLHVPLDNWGDYSTSMTLTKAIGLKPNKPFGPYFGSLCGIFCKTNLKTVSELKKKFEDVIGHKSKIYSYGGDLIEDGQVAVVAGGGNEMSILKEMIKNKHHLLITGITAKSDYSKKVHEFAKQNEITIMGGTHYSTEMFACIAMCNYFEKIGLPAEFIGDKPLMEDM